MIIDTSGLNVILRDERRQRASRRLIEAAADTAPVGGELRRTAAVIDRADDPAADRRVDELLAVARSSIEAVTERRGADRAASLP